MTGHAAGIGTVAEITLVADLFLVADSRRSGPRIGRGSFYLFSRFLTQMGTTACFAAAGSARIEDAGITEDGLPLADVRSRPLPVVFFERQSALIRPPR